MSADRPYRRYRPGNICPSAARCTLHMTYDSGLEPGVVHRSRGESNDFHIPVNGLGNARKIERLDENVSINEPVAVVGRFVCYLTAGDTNRDYVQYYVFFSCVPPLLGKSLSNERHVIGLVLH